MQQGDMGEKPSLQRGTLALFLSALLLCVFLPLQQARAAAAADASVTSGDDIFALANQMLNQDPRGWGMSPATGTWKSSCASWVIEVMQAAGPAAGKPGMDVHGGTGTFYAGGEFGNEAYCAGDSLDYFKHYCEQAKARAGNANIGCPVAPFSPDSPPQPGDIIFWDDCSSSCGHISVSAGGTQTLTTGWSQETITLQPDITRMCDGQPYVLSMNGAGGCSPGGGGGETPTAGMGWGMASCTGGGACSAGSGCGGNSCSGNFFNALAQAESGNGYGVCNSEGCCGKIQFCSAGHWGAGSHCGNFADFAANTNGCQDQEILDYTAGNWNTMAAYGASDLLGKTVTIDGKPYTITQAGLLGAANLCGAYGAYSWAAALVAGSNSSDASDSNGTTCSKYFRNFNGTYMPTDLPWANNTGYGAGSCAPPCGDPVLTGRFTQNPCKLPDAPKDIKPGEKFKAAIQGWWNALTEALKKLTKQLHTQRLTEILRTGRIADAANLAAATRFQQEIRTNAQRDAYPADAVCVAATASAPLAQASDMVTALTEGFKGDLRLVNNLTSPISNWGPRFKNYCGMFRDDKDTPLCPQGSPAIDNVYKNADVRIETFLLKDTINLGDPREYATASTLLVNLVSPFFSDNLTPQVGNTDDGRQYILRRQKLDAVYNLARSVVASIIARRAALPPDADTALGVQEIRQSAGTLPPERLATVNTPPMPSYNEIMQVLTKERFLDPKYFANLRGNPGALKQEQASIDALTTTVMQDIYKMQEQINALLAARAALKIRDDDASLSTATPFPKAGADAAPAGP